MRFSNGETDREYGQDKSYGLIVDYIGIFDDVANALNFDDEAAKKIISNIESLRSRIGEFVEKCLQDFPGVDRTRTDWEGLMEAQACLPTNEERDAFGAQYRVLNKVWNALSPDDCLTPCKADYKWLSKVYDSIRPGDDSGKLIWAALGSKTLQLVHQTHAALMAAVAEDDAGQQAMTETQPEPEQEQPVAGQTTIRVLIKSSGGKVNIRTGNGTSYSASPPSRRAQRWSTWPAPSTAGRP